MSNPIRFHGSATGIHSRIIARVTRTHISSADERADNFLLLEDEGDVLSDVVDGYAGVILESAAKQAERYGVTPVIEAGTEVHTITDGSIIAINPGGQIFTLYRPESSNNSIFATGRCNSDCIMCSQPPISNEPDDMVDEHLRMIDLISVPPDTIGITGGEPTLLREQLIKILSRIKDRLPNTSVHMLTNGRMYAYKDFTREIAGVGLSKFLSAVPLYASNAADHDYIVQSKGAFDETIVGLYNAAENGLDVEIRVVLHKQTVDQLDDLVEFIYRNLPFVKHIALMGLENMGYVKRNWELLWIDPVDYADKLERAVKYMFYRRMNVSIYNLQLCVLPKTVWEFTRKSISDYKNIFLDECEQCSVSDSCGGLFKSSEVRHSRAIHPIGTLE